MKKLLQLAMKRFPSIPVSLRADSSIDKPVKEIEVDILNLCHHLVEDNQEDPYDDEAKREFEVYSRRLLPDNYFKWRGTGPSKQSEGKGDYHNLFGRAFCRWFLYTHFAITYFADIKPILGKPLGSQFFPSMIKRVSKGKTPDFLCAGSSRVSYLAEAKGTQDGIPFDGPLFKEAREQFTRVEVLDAQSRRIPMKGYVVATRMSSENHPRVRSMLGAEDPETKGSFTSEYSEGPSRDLYEAAIRGHYANIFDRLRLPLLAHSLREQFLLPADHQIQVGLWTALVPPIKGNSFIGGFFPSTEKCCHHHRHFGWSQMDLSRPAGIFFGLELDLFLRIRAITLRGKSAIEDVQELQFDTNALTGGFSLSRDGTLLAPLDYLRFDGIRDV